METLYKELDNLKEELDKNENIKKIKELNKIIKKDKKLIQLIEQYNTTKDDNIKKELLNNDHYKEYKHYETEVNFIILELKNKLKIISSKDSCKR